MILSVEEQIRLIIVCVICGITIGVIFDLYRWYRGGHILNKYIVFIQDIIFWIFCGGVVFFISLVFNDAYIDLYGYIIMGVSFLVYLLVFSNIILKFTIKLGDFIGSLIRTTLKTISYPFEIVFRSNINKNRDKFSNKKLEKK